MRKITFYIDDVAYFNHEAPGVGLGNEKSFKAIYTLYGEERNIERYELTDMDGNKIHLADLNGYQKGLILSDCQAYFTGGCYNNGGIKPCGVIAVNDNGIVSEMIPGGASWMNWPGLDDVIANAKKHADPPGGAGDGPDFNQLVRLPVCDERESR